MVTRSLRVSRILHANGAGGAALVGNGAIVLDGVVVGRRTVIAAGCTVPRG